MTPIQEYLVMLYLLTAWFLGTVLIVILLWHIFDISPVSFKTEISNQKTYIIREAAKSTVSILLPTTMPTLNVSLGALMDTCIKVMMINKTTYVCEGQTLP